MDKTYGEGNWQGNPLNYSMLFLRIKMRPGVTKFDRDIIGNSIRSLLTDDRQFVIDTISLEETTELTVQGFQVLLIMIAFISFVIAFFLLLISTS
jgi:hypothetical protein